MELYLTIWTKLVKEYGYSTDDADVLAADIEEIVDEYPNASLDEIISDYA
jgi:hypothetical protein